MELRDRHNNIFLRIVDMNCYDNQGRWAYEKKGEYICNTQGYWVYKIIGDRVLDTQENWIGNVHYPARPAPPVTGKTSGPMRHEVMKPPVTGPVSRVKSPGPRSPRGRNKIYIITAGVVGLIAVMVVVIIAATGGTEAGGTRPASTATVATHTLPYEVITFGRYDEIIYYGDGRFMVSRGGWENQRWGIIDVHGNEIIAFGRYDNLQYLTSDGNFVVRSGRTFYVLDPSGNEITSFDRFDGVSYVTNNRFVANIFSGDTSRAAVIDAQGNEIIPFGRFNNIWAPRGSQWYIVWDGERVGLVDEQSNEIIPLGRYDDIQAVCDERFIVSTWSEAHMISRWALLDLNGQEIIPFGRYDWVNNVELAGNHLIVGDGGLVGIFDMYGNVVLPFRYDGLWPSGENYLIATDGERSGIIDINGQELISIGRYDAVMHAFAGHFLVRSGGEVCEDTWDWVNARWAIVNSQGYEIIPLGRYDGISMVSNDRFVVRIGGVLNTDTWQMEGARMGVRDAYGNEIISIGRYDSITTIGQYAHQFGIAFDFGFVVNAGDRIGVRCIDGQEIIPLGRYDHIQSMINGLAIVERDGRVGLINISRIE